MAKMRLDKVSHASGEIAPLLRARRDLERWNSGHARMVNMVPLPEGAAQRRSGTRFVLPLKNESQQGLLIDFEAAADDSYILNINAGAMRVLRNGGFVESSPGTPYELAVPFAEADLAAVQYAQSIDQVFFAWGKRPKVLTRLSPTSWTITDFDVVEGPVRIQNTDKARTISASGVTGTVTLTASTATFQPGHVGSVWRLDEGDLSIIPSWKAIETGVAIGARRRNRGNVYEALNAATDTGPNAPVHEDGDVSSGAGNTSWRFIHTTSGFVRITGYTSPTVATAIVVKRLPDSVQGAGTFRWFEAAWSDVRGWPTAVALFDGTLVWARGSEVWASKSTDIFSHDETIPEQGAWSVNLLSPDGKLVQIQWLQAAGVLIVGTRAGVWVLRGKDAYERLTSTSVRAVPQSSYGSGAIASVMTEGGAIYVGRSRRNAYFARFDALGERIEVQDLTAFSRRMLHGRAAQIADQRDPFRIMWFRTDDGQCRGLTFVPEQQNLGWSRFSTLDGVVEQVACIQSSSETLTELWMIIRRTIAGTVRRYIEVLQPFFEADDEDAPTAIGAWFLDCALRYAGPPVRVISGLQHLEGSTVGVFCDGDEHPRRIVEGGSITLDRSARDVIVGLPVAWQLKTLPPDFMTPRGPTVGTDKNVNDVALLVHESAGGEIGQDGVQMWPIQGLGRDVLGGPRALTSGVVKTKVSATSARDGALVLGGDGALPFTLLGIYPDVEAGSM
jgi:hypothetical protein